ncbi:MAG: YggS family pyridoxal phosphate-dependent enzyme [Elusimicrobiota bacterium]
MCADPKLFENIRNVKDTIAAACRRAGRSPQEVTLIAVSKGVSAETVAMAQELGLTRFAENRIQEAQEKIAHNPQALWHFIGHLQKNKVGKCLTLGFELIHSVGDIELARKIDACAQAAAKRQNVLMEINVAAEPQKNGFDWGSMRTAVDEMAAMRGLLLTGLMCMGPQGAQEDERRSYYRRMRESLRRIHDTYPDIKELSMGMSQDFHVAIEEGATIVRIGTAIFAEKKFLRPEKEGR